MQECFIFVSFNLFGFFSILLDSTSDSSHVSCYVLPLRQVQSQFVKFLEMGHSASQMLQSLTDFLLAKKIDIKDCRGQSYDDAYDDSLVLIRWNPLTG